MDKEKVVFYEYIHIQNWGVSPSSFVIMLKYDENKSLIKYYFHTGETNVIQTIMIIYCYFIAGKTLKEMIKVIDERDPMFDNNRTNKRVPSKYIKDKEDKFDVNYKNYKQFFVFPNSSSTNNNDN